MQIGEYMAFRPSFKTDLLNLIRIKLKSCLPATHLTGPQLFIFAIIFGAFEDILSNTLRPSEKYLAHQYLQNAWHGDALGLDTTYIRELADKITVVLDLQSDALFEDHFALTI